MNPLDLKLTQLLGDKTLSFGCVLKSSNEMIIFLEPENAENHAVVSFNGKVQGFEDLSDKISCGEVEIIGHPPTIADFHRRMEKSLLCSDFIHRIDGIYAQQDGPVEEDGGTTFKHFISYDCSKSLLEQADGTKEAIIRLVESQS